MKKRFLLAMVLTLVFLFTAIANAEGIITPRADPNSNVDSPKSLPYPSSSGTSSFSFKEYTYTPSLKAPSDGSISITLSNTKLSVNRTITCSIEVCYWDGNYWKSKTVSPSSFSVNNTSDTYSFSCSGIPSGKSFYVGLSKSDYKSASVTGGIKVSD